MIIPTLVIACFGVAMLGTSFAANIDETDELYTIRVDIINGKQDAYIKKISGGEFREIIDSDATFSNITCSSGNLNFDTKTNSIYNENVNENINCVLAFMDDGTKSISKTSLESVNDNDGVSYYYKGDAKNNYILLNNVLFRIVRINGDGTYRLILDNNISDASYNDINDILNNWFSSFTHSNIVMKDYDIANYNDVDKTNLISFNGYIISDVGLLSVREANLINDNVKDSYLDGNFYLGNKDDLDNVWVIDDSVIKKENIERVNGVRPVINISIDKLRGNGTKELPYEIER